VEKVNREEKIVKAVPSRADTQHGKNKKTVPDEVEDEGSIYRLELFLSSQKHSKRFVVGIIHHA
jgi:hypothetical protein